MIIRKFVISILSVCFITGFLSAVLAHEVNDGYRPLSHNRVAGPHVTPRDLAPVLVPNFEDAVVRGQTANIIVTVTSPMDQHWRARYRSPNWEANRTIEAADDFLVNEFGIDLRSVAQPIWTSTGIDSTSILNNAVSQHGLTFHGNQKADLMKAFSASPNAGQVMGEVTAIPSQFAIVFDWGYNENVLTTRHELGHMYGLHHCPVLRCFMFAQPTLNELNVLCPACWTRWNNEKNRY